MEGWMDRILSYAQDDISVCFFSNGIRISETTSDISHKFKVLCCVTRCGPDQLDAAEELLQEEPMQDDADYLEQYRQLRNKLIAHCPPSVTENMPNETPCDRNNLFLAIRVLRQYILDNFNKLNVDVLPFFPKHDLIYCDADYYRRVNLIKRNAPAFEEDYVFMMEYIDEETEEHTIFHAVHNAKREVEEINFIEQNLG